MNEESRREIRSLGELPQSIEPPRDLWPGIAASLQSGGEGGAAVRDARRDSRSTGRWGGPWQIAAAFALVAVGAWLGRATGPGTSEVDAPIAATDGATLQPAIFDPGARFERTRDALLREASVKLAGMPPETRAKVAASLETVQDARRDIELALGRDPGNALLQEMLVNSYQDEMRVLTAVQDSWPASEENGA
jgi:hypothetical protein